MRTKYALKNYINNKEKGFTLIELLAVIIILAVIALITIPIVMNMINSAKKSAAVSSAYGYVDAINYAQGLADFDNSYERLSDGTYETSEITKLKMKGKKPLYGDVTIENNIVKTANICIGGYMVNYANKKAETSGKCSEREDETDPVILINEVSTTTSSIVLDFTADDPESGIKSITCKVGDITGTIEAGKCTISGLTNHTEYTYEITAKNGQNRTKIVSDTITTGEFQSIVISKEPNNNTWAQSRTITITGKRENETLEYQIVNGIEDIDDDNWATYTTAIQLTENKSVIARLSDGTNVSSAQVYTEDHIDRSAPTEANVTKGTVTSNSIQVTANGIDGQSNIYGYLFSKDNGATWESTAGVNIPQTSNSYTFSNLTSGTYQIKSKVVNNTYPNSPVNELNSIESSVNAIATGEIPVPTFTVDPEGIARSKTVTINYPAGYTNTYSLDGNTWLPYSQAIVFEDNGTIIARATDSSGNYVESSTQTIDGIIKESAEDVEYDDTNTHMGCSDAQCAIEALERMYD